MESRSEESDKKLHIVFKENSLLLSMLQNEDVRNSSDKFDVLGLQVGRNHGQARITKFWVTEFNDTCQSLRVTPYDVVQKQ